MKTNTKVNRMTRAERAASQLIDIHDVEEMIARADCPVVHETITEFLRRVTPVETLDLDARNRFGATVRKTADGLLQLAFVAKMHPQLGPMRVYPTPLLEWLFTKMFGPSQLALDNERTRELRRHEGAKKHLAAAAGHAPTPAVAEALTIVMNWLDVEAGKLKGTPKSDPTKTATVPHLRPV